MTGYHGNIPRNIHPRDAKVGDLESLCGRTHVLKNSYRHLLGEYYFFIGCFLATAMKISIHIIVIWGTYMVQLSLWFIWPRSARVITIESPWKSSESRESLRGLYPFLGQTSGAKIFGSPLWPWLCTRPKKSLWENGVKIVPTELIDDPSDQF